MDSRQLLNIARKWWWLLLLASFVGGSISYITASRRPVFYRAEVKMIVGGYLPNPDPSPSDIASARQLVLTYIELVRTTPVMNAAAASLQLGLTGDQLRGLVDTRTVPETSLFTIGASFTDPVVAADVANAVAQALITNGPTNLTADQQNQIDVAQAQITALNAQITDLNAQLANVTAQLNATTDDDARLMLGAQRSTLVDQISQSRSTVASFTNIITAYQQRTNKVEVVEPARIPTRASGVSITNATAAGAFVGAVISGGLVILFEYFNDTFQTAEQVKRLLNVPVLGVVSRFGGSKKHASYRDALITNQALLSRTPEEYRTIRTNLMFTLGDRAGKVYVVSSALPQEGKSVTTANLAVSMALAGQRVLLIDADLRRPRQHEIFGLPNDVGLTSLLAASPFDGEATLGRQPSAEALNDTHQYVQRTGVPGLSVITSGFLPRNPYEILGSALMQHWTRAFQESANVDLVIFDTPPCLAVSDSPVLAASVDANVILVVEANSTRRTAVQRAKERFTSIDSRLIGVILNGANRQVEDYYGYGDTYYYAPDVKPAKSR